MRFNDSSDGEVLASIKVGRFTVPFERLKPYLEHHGLTTDKDAITLEVRRLRQRTSRLSDDFTEFVEVQVVNNGEPTIELTVEVKRIGRGSTELSEFIEVELVDNGDPGIDGKLMCIGFDDLVQIGE